MAISRLEFSSWIAVPVPRIFRFFSNPENLPRLMPPATETRVEGFQLVPPPMIPTQDAVDTRQAAGKGSIIDTSFRPLRFLSRRQKLTVAIVEFEWDHHFVDVQQKGPFKRWRHRHEFIADWRNGFDGTSIRDAIEYEVGFGFLGSLLDHLFVKRNLRQMFAYRQKKVEQLFSESERRSEAAD